MMTFEINNMPVLITRTKRRKRVSIKVDAHAIYVNAPKYVLDIQIKALLSKKVAWIENASSFYAKHRPVRHYKKGEIFSYLGQNFRLNIKQGKQETTKTPIAMPTRIQGAVLELKLPVAQINCPEAVYAALSLWYQSRALRFLNARTDYYGDVMNVRPSSVKIRDYKSCWGVCSSSQRISYNWRIIMAPFSVVDYLVVHEMCHLLEMNHSPKYWTHVARFFPDFKAQRQWLKTYGFSLIL